MDRLYTNEAGEQGRLLGNALFTHLTTHGNYRDIVLGPRSATRYSITDEEGYTRAFIQATYSGHKEVPFGVVRMNLIERRYPGVGGFDLYIGGNGRVKLKASYYGLGDHFPQQQVEAMLQQRLSFDRPTDKDSLPIDWILKLLRLNLETSKVNPIEMSQAQVDLNTSTHMEPNRNMIRVNTSRINVLLGKVLLYLPDAAMQAKHVGNEYQADFEI
jgi:hypothetical protein